MTAWNSYGARELAEYVGTGGTVFFSRMFAYAPGLDEPVASVAPGGVSTYQFRDALGSVIALANDSGQVTEKYAYTAYGINTVTGPGSAAYRFAGRRFDTETGLYHNRARAYSPTLGRLLQTDPVGTKDNINLYAYVANDPVNKTDPMGLEKQVGIALGGTVAWILGVNGSVNPGISIPDNLWDVGSYQAFVSVQVTGYAGVGGYAGYGGSLTGGHSDGPLDGFQAGPTWQAEVDAGFGPSIGASIGGNRTNCSGSGNSCTWEAPSSGSFTPNPKLGAGFGAYAGAGPGATMTLASPTFGQMADYVTSGYNTVSSWFSESKSGK